MEVAPGSEYDRVHQDYCEGDSQAEGVRCCHECRRIVSCNGYVDAIGVKMPVVQRMNLDAARAAQPPSDAHPQAVSQGDFQSLGYALASALSETSECVFLFKSPQGLAARHKRHSGRAATLLGCSYLNSIL